MLRDYLVKYYYPGNDYNYSCSEAMLHAIDEYYGLNLPKELFYASCGFGGGARHDELCGGLASAIAVLGILYSVNGRGHESDKMRQLTAELLQKVDERFGTTRCNRLKAENYIPEHKCEPLLVVIADMLEDIISKNPIINK